MYALFQVFKLLSVDIKAAKLRSWLGPEFYYEGKLPSVRSGHGFVSDNSGKFYEFGGIGENGNIAILLQEISN